MSRVTPPTAGESGTLCGVLVLDKPPGMSSHDAVVRVRRALGVARIGHAGTLDPMATGVLVLAVGEATKLVPWLTAHDKTYETTVALGIATDTLDADGRQVEQVEPAASLRDALREWRARAAMPLLGPALAVERARTKQVPPSYSAIRTGGERAFSRARRGETPRLEARDVKVERLDLVGCSVDPPALELELQVSKGYYVRALARDLAAALGTVGHLARLRRTQSGAFGIAEAVRLDSSVDVFRSHLRGLPVAAARALPTARLSGAGASDARRGRSVAADDIEGPPAGPCAWLDPAGALVAVGELDHGGRGRVLRGFVE